MSDHINVPEYVLKAFQNISPTIVTLEGDLLSWNEREKDGTVEKGFAQTIDRYINMLQEIKGMLVSS